MIVMITLISDCDKTAVDSAFQMEFYAGEFGSFIPNEVSTGNCNVKESNIPLCQAHAVRY